MMAVDANWAATYTHDSVLGQSEHYSHCYLHSHTIRQPSQAEVAKLDKWRAAVQREV